MTIKTSIRVTYRYKDGWHIFESKDVSGLYIANQDPEIVFRDIVPVIEHLLEHNEGIHCKVEPEPSFSDFLTLARNQTDEFYKEFLDTVGLSNRRYAVVAEAVA